jgi:hypothetical protein
VDLAAQFRCSLVRCASQLRELSKETDLLRMRSVDEGDISAWRRRTARFARERILLVAHVSESAL